MMNSYIKKVAVLFITSVQISCCLAEFDTILEPLSDVIYVCHGMKITFKCNESTIDFLTWTWQNSDMNSYDNHPSILQRLNTTEVLSSLDGVTTTLTDFRTNGSIYIESTLQFTPSGIFISANVSCNRERRVVKISVLPEINNFNLHNFVNNTNNSAITLTWDIVTTVDEYVVNISSPQAILDLIYTTSSFLNLKLQYNTEYTVTIVATNCIGQSSAVYKIHLVNCPDPSSSPGVEVISYSTATNEGSIFTYRCAYGCNPEFSTVCGNDKAWHPIVHCPPQTSCDLPPLDRNAQLIHISENRLEGDLLFYKCTDEFSPTGVANSTCTSEGQWKPNPMEHICSRLQRSNSILLPSSILAAALVSVIAVAVMASLGTFILGWKFSRYFHLRTLQAAAAQVSKDHNSSTNLELNQVNETLVTSTSEVTAMYDDIVIKKEDEMVNTTQNIAYGTISVKTKD